MRSPIWFALLAIVVAVVPVVAQQPDKKDEPKLKIGDPAPPLTVGKWHQGPEVKEFEKGKVYVVVFWWLLDGQSYDALRVLNSLHAKHKDVIPVAVSNSSKEKRPGQLSDFERVDEFVTKAKPKFTFAFVDEEAGATRKAYGLTVTSDPAIYVVGKDGKIAFVAPKLGETILPELTEVLPKVLDGSWKGQKDADALAETEKEFQKAMNYVAKMRELGPDFLKQPPEKQAETKAKVAAESLKAVDEFVKAHPTFAGQPRTLSYRSYMAVQSGQKEVAVKAVDAVIADNKARGTVKDMVELAKGVGTEYAEDRLSPEVGADKLVGTIIDAVLKGPINPDDTNDLQYLMTISILVGTPEKGRAIIEKLFQSAPADTPAEAKKMLTQQFEEQVKQIEAYLKERKKK